MQNNEVYLAVFGTNYGNFLVGEGFYPTEGQPSAVEFDHNIVLGREKSNNNLVGFYHTHPHMNNYYSSTDYKTMESWVDTVGRPLLCFIEGVNGLACYFCCNFNDKFLMMKIPCGRFKELFMAKIDVQEALQESKTEVRGRRMQYAMSDVSSPYYSWNGGVSG